MVPVPVPGHVRLRQTPGMSFLPFTVSIRRRRRATRGHPAQASGGNNHGNTGTANPPTQPGYPPTTGYGNIQDWADNIQPNRDNGGSDQTQHGNGNAGGGSQQELLNRHSQQGNGNGNEGAQQDDENGNEASNNNNARNNANNDDGNSNNNILGKRDVFKAFLASCLEGFRIRSQTIREKFRTLRGQAPGIRTVPAQEPPPRVPGGVSGSVPVLVRL
ncbi:hypothetical protein VUR80DRAFT_1760 [Thermomyces stellatus]